VWIPSSRSMKGEQRGGHGRVPWIPSVGEPFVAVAQEHEFRPVSELRYQRVVSVVRGFAAALLDLVLSEDVPTSRAAVPAGEPA
jgi:hypothetical protein